MERYIFLDINGVLQVRADLEPELLDRFAQLVKDTEAIVVLSSTWRKHNFSFKLIRNALRERGVWLRFTTPQCEYKEIKENPLHHEGFALGDIKRTHEILLWLEDYETEAWIALDDELLGLRPEHFVHTTSYEGLTEEKAAEAKEKLLAFGKADSA